MTQEFLHSTRVIHLGVVKFATINSNHIHVYLVIWIEKKRNFICITMVHIKRTIMVFHFAHSL